MCSQRGEENADVLTIILKSSIGTGAVSLDWKVVCVTLPIKKKSENRKAGNYCKPNICCKEITGVYN